VTLDDDFSFSKKKKKKKAFDLSDMNAALPVCRAVFDVVNIFGSLFGYR